MTKDKRSASTVRVVAKFGGTSVAGAVNMGRCANIIFNNPEIKLVVVSATAGTTNHLLALGRHALLDEWHECEALFRTIKNRHLLMANELGADQDFIDDLLSLLEELRELALDLHQVKTHDLRKMDALLGFGEIISSKLMGLCLEKYGHNQPIKLHWFDVRKVLRTDDHFGEARPQIEEIRQLAHRHLLPLMGEHDVVITQGFIGATSKGVPTTLGRGGSDFSASLLAEATDASVLQIWTDVPGVSSMDPKIIHQAKTIDEMTYSEAAELANLGAKVLHPLTLIPVMRKDIPVYVGSTFHFDQKGTWIRRETRAACLIRALASRPSQSILTLSKIKGPDSYGFLARAFSILARHRISIDLISTSEISTAMTLHDPDKINETVLTELRELAEVEWESGLTLISVIGQDLVTPPGVAALIFQAIKDHSIRFICMGSGRNNISFLVQQRDEGPILSKLHRKFIEHPSRAVAALSEGGKNV